MTFPVVAAVNYSEETSNTTTHDVLLPASISAGDLLMLFAGIDGIPTISDMPAGWTQAKRLVNTGDVNVLEIWYKVAAGGETDFTYTTSASEKSANRTWRVTGHGSAIEVSTGVTASTANPDPDSLAPSWGALDTLWAVALTWNNAAATISSYPANFTLYQYSDASGTANSDGTIAIAGRENNAVSEDPGTFTLSASTATAVVTVAIKPVVAGGDPEGSLIGGKLIRGGLLKHGVLVRG